MQYECHYIHMSSIFLSLFFLLNDAIYCRITEWQPCKNAEKSALFPYCCRIVSVVLWYIVNFHNCHRYCCLKYGKVSILSVKKSEKSSCLENRIFSNQQCKNMGKPALFYSPFKFSSSLYGSRITSLEITKQHTNQWKWSKDEEEIVIWKFKFLDMNILMSKNLAVLNT